MHLECLNIFTQFQNLDLIFAHSLQNHIQNIKKINFCYDAKLNLSLWTAPVMAHDAYLIYLIGLRTWWP